MKNCQLEKVLESLSFYWSHLETSPFKLFRQHLQRRKKTYDIVCSGDTGKSTQQEQGSADLTSMCGQIFYDEGDMTGTNVIKHCMATLYECF